MAEGEFALAKDHLQQARNKATDPVKWGSAATEQDLYAIILEAAVGEQDEAELRRYATQLERLANQNGHKLYQGVAHRALGVAHRLAGEYAQASERLNMALMIFEALGTRWQAGRTLCELGELALLQTDTATARANLSRALQAFEGLRALPDATKVRERLATVVTQRT